MLDEDVCLLDFTQVWFILEADWVSSVSPVSSSLLSLSAAVALVFDGLLHLRE